jgi:succinate dehydrogenase / fumarate reductase, iron-sulfur subunit
MRESELSIARYDPTVDGEAAPAVPRYNRFVVSYEKSMTVLEALLAIQEEQDSTLAFRYCCRASICGSCAMYIGGRYRLACQTNLGRLDDGTLTIEPLPHFPLIRDLVCDMSGFFAKYELIRPWLIREIDHPEKEIRQTPRDRRKLDMPIDCILCGCCHSSCPSVWANDEYLGPAALLKTYRFEVDSRDQGRAARLPFFDNEQGAYRCHAVTNCVEACPKELNPTEGIQWLKRAAVRRRLLRLPK